MRRLLISVAVVAVALLAQVTFVNRLVLPGGAGPDLVLLAVVALALTGGPLPGTADRLPGRAGARRRAAREPHDRPVRAGVLPGRLRLRPAGGAG